MNKIEKIKQFTKERFDELRWLHTQDVVSIALILAEKEGADKEIVEISAWLHDIGTTDKRAKIITHHIYSAEIVQGLLKELDFEPKKIEQIIRCIKEHMGPINTFDILLRAEGKTQEFLPRPSTIESKVVYDADMINLCSPFGVVKTIILNTKEGKNFKEIINNIKTFTTQAFNDLKTKSGKEIGKKYFFMSREFLEMVELQAS